MRYCSILLLRSRDSLLDCERPEGCETGRDGDGARAGEADAGGGGPGDLRRAVRRLDRTIHVNARCMHLLHVKTHARKGI